MLSSRRARTSMIMITHRIPFARANGRYAGASNQDMLTAALDGLVARFGLQDERLGAVAAGPSVPWFGGVDIRTSVDGGKRLTQIGAHRSDARRAGRTVIHTTPMSDNGRRYGLQFMTH